MPARPKIQAMLLWAHMRRALHIAVTLIVALLLLRPFECFAAGDPTSKVADCCLKGKCAPTANSDACCRNSIPDRDHFVPLNVAGHLHLSPPIAIAAVYVPAPAPRSTLRIYAGSVRHQPPRIELIAPSLPFL